MAKFDIYRLKEATKIFLGKKSLKIDISAFLGPLFERRDQMSMQF
jgi:hypothetical protein